MLSFVVISTYLEITILLKAEYHNNTNLYYRLKYLAI